MTRSDELRLGIARSHGLPDDATRFLSGETIDQIEASAAALVKLTGSQPEATPAPPRTRSPEAQARRPHDNGSSSPHFMPRPHRSVTSTDGLPRGSTVAHDNRFLRHVIPRAITTPWSPTSPG